MGAEKLAFAQAKRPKNIEITAFSQNFLLKQRQEKTEKNLLVHHKVLFNTGS